MTRCLFVTWDGPQTTYLESLYFPILAAARAHAVTFEVLQFTWRDRAAGGSALDRTRAAAAHHGIAWRAIELPASMPAAARAMAAIPYGAYVVAREVSRSRPQVVMPRALIPAAMVLGARRAGSSFRLAFDADGLQADERVELRALPSTSRIYRALRAIETRALRGADAVLTRTDAARDILEDRRGTSQPPILVVPNGRDPGVFTPGTEASRARTRAALGVATDAPVIAYVGSLGPQYLPDELARFIKAAQAARPDTRFLMMTGQPEVFAAAAQRVGLDLRGGLVGPVAPADVPARLAMADVGLSLRVDSLSQRAVSPVKDGEYLLCGVPVLASRAPADATDVIHTWQGPQEAVRWLFDDVLPRRAALREAARDYGSAAMSLEACAAGYAHAVKTAAR